MKIILTPVSPKEIDQITITSEQFPIGRQERPFSNYPEAIQKVLSRRHARIFMQDGQFYIIDMGSSNGTVVNNIEVRDRPHALKPGDQICFANKLTYKVEIDKGNVAQKATPQNEIPLYLHMTPEDAQSTIDSIVIMSFPFMVSRTDDVFSRYQNNAPEEVNFLSRRHAYIFEKNGSLYIEDLKSANGTFVNEEILKDEAVQLKSGEVLGFGGYYFRYRIRIEGEKDDPEKDETIIQQSCQQDKQNVETGAVMATVVPGNNENKTLFISSATSFLDIFCFQEKLEKEDTREDECYNEQKKTEKEANELGLLSKQRNFLSNLAKAFHDTESNNGSSIKIAALVILSVIAVGMGWYFLTAEKRSITIACAGEEYVSCMDASMAYLRSGETDGEIVQLAFNAALKSYLPDWIEKVINHQGKESSAISELTAFQGDLYKALSMTPVGEDEKVLAADSKASKDVELVKEMQRFDDTIALLSNVNELELFITQRGDSDGKIRIDEDEKKIADIVDKWQVNTDRDRRVMLDIIKQVPQFDELRMNIFSYLGDLRNDKSLYLAAIRSFKERLNNADSKNENRMLAEVDRFQKKYPRIVGLDAYRDDIRLYHKIKDTQQEGSDEMLHIQASAKQFKTALFSDLYLKESSAKPLEGDAAKYFSQAMEQWSEGFCEESINSLENIHDSQWVELVQAEIKRQKSICQQFDELNVSERGDGHENALLQFYASLEKEKDKYFINQIESEISAYKSKLQDKAAGLLKKAMTEWENYTRQGGIKKLQRLDNNISVQFKEQSQRIVRANQYTDQIKVIYHLLDVELTSEQKEKLEGITSELDYQRKALEDLSNISGSRQIAEAKLQLLMK